MTGRRRLFGIYAGKKIFADKINAKKMCLSFSPHSISLKLMLLCELNCASNAFPKLEYWLYLFCFSKRI